MCEAILKEMAKEAAKDTDHDHTSKFQFEQIELGSRNSPTSLVTIEASYASNPIFTGFRGRLHCFLTSWFKQLLSKDILKSVNERGLSAFELPTTHPVC